MVTSFVIFAQQTVCASSLLYNAPRVAGQQRQRFQIHVQDFGSAAVARTPLPHTLLCWPPSWCGSPLSASWLSPVAPLIRRYDRQSRPRPFYDCGAVAMLRHARWETGVWIRITAPSGGATPALTQQAICYKQEKAGSPCHAPPGGFNHFQGWWLPRSFLMAEEASLLKKVRLGSLTAFWYERLLTW